MWRWVAALALRTVVARDSLETILERIVEPVFPDVNFDVLNYGALPDNATDALPAFAAALEAASAAGGGQVVASAPGRVFVVCGGLEVASRRAPLHREANDRAVGGRAVGYYRQS